MTRPLHPLLAASLLLGAIALAYANSLRVPFVFDDAQAITENASIRRGWSWEIFAPPAHTTVTGRPLVNASLALNHALGREDVRGYHAFNLALHAAAALALFGLLRRTRCSTEVAFAAALLWALHPLQTESVTYVVQRAEAMMGLFYLLTLYCFARGWLVASAVACLLGMATKEVMVTAPLVVALYDRVFVGGSWSAVARRSRYYAALALTWLPLAWLAVHAGDRAGTAGLSAGATIGGYALTQCRALLLYLKLAFWPHPLVFDYGPYVAPDARELAPAFVAVLALLALVAWLARRRPKIGFAAAAFLLVLAPTTSVLPIVTEPIAEHRMYLPLAALAALAALGIFLLGPRRGFVAITLLAFGCGALTFARNRVYASERTLWAATVEAAPKNPRAHYSLALAEQSSSDLAAAETHFQRALALRPDYVGVRHSYAALLSQLGSAAFQGGDLALATTEFEAAVRLYPDSAAAHNNLGCVLYERGDWPAARAHEETAVRLQPEAPQNHYNLGNALARLGLNRDARAAYERALQLAPDYVEAHLNLGAVLEALGERAAAAEHYRAVIRLQQGNAFARQRLDALAPAQR